MSLQDALKLGLDSVPGCQTVCYVDMASGLVLASQSQSHHPQEFYDRIGTLAASILQGNGLAAAQAQFPDLANEATVTIYGRAHTHVFARSLSISEHALCYMSKGPANPDVLQASILENRKIVANAF